MNVFLISRLKTILTYQFNSCDSEMTNRTQSHAHTYPLTWMDLQKYDKNPPRISLTRTVEMETKYEEHKRKLSQNEQQIDDYIKNKYFSDENENKKFICVPNAFPYNCESHIKHYLIWVNPKFNKYFPESLNYSKYDPMVTKEVHDKFGTDVNEFIFFENIMELKSVKTIRHIHIFIKHKL